MATGPASGLPQAPVGGQPPFSFGPAPIAPGFDTLSILPPAAAERLRLLRLRAADAHAVTVPFEDVRTASMARIDAENALRRLQAHASEGGFGLKPDARQVIEAQRLLDRLTAEFTRLTDRQATRAAAFQASSAALAKCEDWLKHGVPGNCTLDTVETEPVRLLKNETVLDAIERLRRRVRELRADLHRIASSPMPSSYCKAKMRAQIEALAQRGEPSASLLIEHDGEIDFATMRQQSTVYNATPEAVAYAQVVDVVGLVAFLFKEQVAKKLSELIDTEADDAAAMSTEQRQKAEAEVMSDLLDTERQIASLVWRGQSEGLPCDHGDCSPQAVLGVALIVSPRAIDGPTTSPFAFDLIQPGGGRRR